MLYLYLFYLGVCVTRNGNISKLRHYPKHAIHFLSFCLTLSHALSFSPYLSSLFIYHISIPHFHFTYITVKAPTQLSTKVIKILPTFIQVSSFLYLPPLTLFPSNTFNYFMPSHSTFVLLCFQSISFVTTTQTNDKDKYSKKIKINQTHIFTWFTNNNIFVF